MVGFDRIAAEDFEPAVGKPDRRRVGSDRDASDLEELRQRSTRFGPEDAEGRVLGGDDRDLLAHHAVLGEVPLRQERKLVERQRPRRPVGTTNAIRRPRP